MTTYVPDYEFAHYSSRTGPSDLVCKRLQVIEDNAAYYRNFVNQKYSVVYNALPTIDVSALDSPMKVLDEEAKCPESSVLDTLNTNISMSRIDVSTMRELSTINTSANGFAPLSSSKSTVQMSKNIAVAASIPLPKNLETSSSTLHQPKYWARAATRPLPKRYPKDTSPTRLQIVADTLSQQSSTTQSVMSNSNSALNSNAVTPNKVHIDSTCTDSTSTSIKPRPIITIKWSDATGNTSIFKSCALAVKSSFYNILSPMHQHISVPTAESQDAKTSVSEPLQSSESDSPSSGATSGSTVPDTAYTTLDTTSDDVASERGTLPIDFTGPLIKQEPLLCAILQVLPSSFSAHFARIEINSCKLRNIKLLRGTVIWDLYLCERAAPHVKHRVVLKVCAQFEAGWTEATIMAMLHRHGAAPARHGKAAVLWHGTVSYQDNWMYYMFIPHYGEVTNVNVVAARFTLETYLEQVTRFLHGWLRTNPVAETLSSLAHIATMATVRLPRTSSMVSLSSSTEMPRLYYKSTAQSRRISVSASQPTRFKANAPIVISDSEDDSDDENLDVLVRNRASATPTEAALRSIANAPSTRMKRASTTAIDALRGSMRGKRRKHAETLTSASPHSYLAQNARSKAQALNPQKFDRPAIEKLFETMRTTRNYDEHWLTLRDCEAGEWDLRFLHNDTHLNNFVWHPQYGITSIDYGSSVLLLPRYKLKLDRRLVNEDLALANGIYDWRGMVYMFLRLIAREHYLACEHDKTRLLQWNALRDFLRRSTHLDTPHDILNRLQVHPVLQYLTPYIATL